MRTNFSQTTVTYLPVVLLFRDNTKVRINNKLILNSFLANEFSTTFVVRTNDYQTTTWIRFTCIKLRHSF